MTRKSTPKYQVEHVKSGVIVGFRGVSKTEATKFARQMSGNRRGDFIAIPMRHPSIEAMARLAEVSR